MLKSLAINESFWLYSNLLYKTSYLFIRDINANANDTNLLDEVDESPSLPSPRGRVSVQPINDCLASECADWFDSALGDDENCDPEEEPASTIIIVR